MTLLLKHTFSGSAGTFTLNGITPDYLDASWAGTTFGFPAGTASRDGSGYATADATRILRIEIPAGQKTTHSWIVEYRGKYDKATPSTSDNLDFGTWTDATNANQYICRTVYNSGAGNYYAMSFRRLPSAVFGATDILGERTEDANGNPITAGGGTNPSAGDMRLYVKKVGSTFYHGYDVGRGIKWFPSATDATTDLDGVPWVNLYNGTWKCNQILVWSNGDKNLCESGTFDPTIDPASMARIKKVFDMAAENLKVGPGADAWIGEVSQSLTVPFTNATLPMGKYRNGVKWTAGTHGYAFYPANGLVRTRNVTFGCWVHMDTAWASWTGNLSFVNVGVSGSYPDHIYIKRASSTTFAVNTAQTKGAGTIGGDIGGNYLFPFGDVPNAGDDVLFLISIRRDGKVEVGVNANLCKMSTGTNPSFTVPAISDGDWFECSWNEDGLVLGVEKSTVTRNPNCTVSDFFVLDSAHWPGHAIPASLGNILTCDPDTPDSGINPSTKHAGCLSRRKSSGAFASLAAGAMGFMRDSAKKALAVMAELSANANGSTANVAGLTPGSPWFYNWGNIDNDLAWMKQCLDFGGGNYGYYEVDLGGVPRRLQDAAGPTANYMAIGTDTTEGQSFVSAMPNDGSNTGTYAGNNVVLGAGTIAKMNYLECDIYLYIKSWCTANNFPFSHISWGWWNEANTASFWPTTHFTNQRGSLQSLWHGLQVLIAANDAGYAGMDFISSTHYSSAQADYTSWMSAIHTNGDDAKAVAVHAHSYQGDINCYHDYATRKIEADRVTGGCTASMNHRNGENCFNIVYGPGIAGSPQWTATAADNLYCNKVGAAWLAQIMISCAKSIKRTGLTKGIEEHVLTGVWEQNPDGSTGTNGAFGITGIVNNACTGLLAPGNVMKMWQMMALDTPGTAGRASGTSSWSGDPGIGHMVTKVGVTRDRYFMVNYSPYSRTVTVQTLASRKGWSVLRYVMNASHSSDKDTAGHLTLETVGDVVVVDPTTAQMTFTMAPYEVTVLDTTLPSAIGGGGHGPNRGLSIRIRGAGIG